MPVKLLTGSDGPVPDQPPPPSELGRAPNLENGDQFWDKVTTYPESSINTDAEPLLLEPEIEASETTAHHQLPASSIPRLLIEGGDSPYYFLQYTSTAATTNTSRPGESDWVFWSRYILDNEAYRDILNKVNIYKPVQLFSSLTVQIDQANLGVLLSRWCSETHTFVASWGEFSPSLEDVCELFYLPVFGIANGPSKEDQEIVEALRSAATEAAQWGSRFQGSVLLYSPSTCLSKYPTHAQWLRHFFRDYEPISNEIGSPRRSVTGPQYGKRYELAAFLSYWLDRFIFEGKPDGAINQRVFPLAAVLSRGRTLPLAPMFLGTLYYRLDMLKQDCARSLGRYEVTTYVSCSFLTLFLFERFPSYAPPPKTFCEKDENGKTRSLSRALRWTNLTTPCKLGDYIDGFENFCARPYGVKLDGIVFPRICGGPEDVVAVLKDDFNFKTLKFIAIVCKCVLPYITETGKGAVAYNPTRIARQFGYDQGVPESTSCQGSYTSSCARFRSSHKLVLSQYPASFTMPSCKRQGRYTAHFRKYWAKILKLFAFPSGSPQPLEAVPIFEDDVSLKAPQKRKRQPPLINRRPPKWKRMRVVPKPIKIQDSASNRHLNSEDINLNAPEAENINVAPATASSAGASLPNTSLTPPLPPPPKENIGINELVQWHGYKCRFRSIPYLDCIFHTYPETFDSFRVKSAYFQRVYLDALASLIKSIEEKSISQIPMHNINLARDLIMDCKSVGLDLSWLELKYADATARLTVHGLNQESARISAELQQNNMYATQLRRYLAAKEAKTASLTARCKELAKKISFHKTLIDSNLSSEDNVLKDLLTDDPHPENLNTGGLASTTRQVQLTN
ncbi:uncharacterized protein LOC132315693 [Cornus florida]|uniref:uncharacterized protein LOC132315693 n=1 Tax=Cornus florida TaxID=4283 RepID=UPI002898463C|nr:uncharacterized protein LOC132315693 [Cornus florida]